MSEEKGVFGGLYDIMFGRSWSMLVGSILLAVLSIGMFLVKSPWGACGGVKDWGMSILGWTTTSVIASRYGMLMILLFIGAMASALLAREFAIRIPPGGELVKGLIGGLLMGVGAMLGSSCTIGGFFSGWPSLSAGAFVFTLGMVIGVFIAVKYLLWEVDKFPGASSGKARSFLAAATGRKSLQPLAGIIIIIIGAAIALTYDAATTYGGKGGGTGQVMIGFVLIGLMIGFVLQRSRWCIVRALREPFMTGDAKPAMAIMAGILVGLFGFTVIKIMGIGSEAMFVFPNFWVPGIVGGTLFGLGMTIAGGCTVGSVWRAGEGHVKLWASVVGMVIGMPVTVKYLKPGFLAMLPDTMKQGLFLPSVVSYTGAVMIVLVFITIWYAIVKWNERTGKLSAL